ncbi:hypothetical protein G6F40_017333 [Rhizopus arrhizus]|nr:hypothetical protein G6F40_017333 [Rhizopus arrhizus]
MLSVIGSPSLAALIEEVVPAKLRSQAPLALPPSRSETDVLAELKQIAGRNKVYRNYIGQGYYGTQTPNVVLRNILENPACPAELPDHGRGPDRAGHFQRLAAG